LDECDGLLMACGGAVVYTKIKMKHEEESGFLFVMYTVFLIGSSLGVDDDWWRK